MSLTYTRKAKLADVSQIMPIINDAKNFKRNRVVPNGKVVIPMRTLLQKILSKM